jgi:hypothetical protein
MYGVVKYLNYRKEVSFEIIKTFSNLCQAKSCAFDYAVEEFGEDNISEGVIHSYVWINNVSEIYTTENGYDQYVFTVINIPDLIH